MQKERSDDVEIREMKEEDLDQIIAIEKKSFAAPWSEKLFRDTLSFPLSHSFIARKKVDNKVVGYANFYLIKNEVQILNIAVAPEYRKKGYAAKLLEHAITVLRGRKAEEFFLEVREGNADAIRLYKGFGFRKVGRRKRYYSETNEDAFVMYMRVK
ncbi:MAG: ribosomal-protein-alanine N-acetyltransferase [Syntrophorhabdaceae bacterium PtaU1.Bin034]|nr:MAG: ribosomal-protein-alanine N-acetyltransferase [Syntrophorhabdaceae bacterium PtaU1.Bin034]